MGCVWEGVQVTWNKCLPRDLLPNLRSFLGRRAERVSITCRLPLVGLFQYFMLIHYGCIALPFVFISVREFSAKIDSFSGLLQRTGGVTSAIRRVHGNSDKSSQCQGLVFEMLPSNWLKAQNTCCEMWRWFQRPGCFTPARQSHNTRLPPTMQVALTRRAGGRSEGCGGLAGCAVHTTGIYDFFAIAGRQIDCLWVFIRG